MARDFPAPQYLLSHPQTPETQKEEKKGFTEKYVYGTDQKKDTWKVKTLKPSTSHLWQWLKSLSI